MNYTVQVNEVQGKDGNIRAFANVVFGECFKITNIAILENKEKEQFFVSMPRYRSGQRNEKNEPVYKDVCNPITKEFREELYPFIMEEYDSVKNRTKGTTADKTKDDKSDEKNATGLEFSVSVTVFEREDSDIKGIARIFLENCFVINNVTIIQGKDNLFVAMPSYQTKKVDANNKPIYQDVCYPVTKEFREVLYAEILETYEKERDKKFHVETTVEREKEKRIGENMPKR